MRNREPDIARRSLVLVGALALSGACQHDGSEADGGAATDAGVTGSGATEASADSEGTAGADAGVTTDAGPTDEGDDTRGSGTEQGSDSGTDGDPPLPALRGWELTETNTGLAALGLSCDDLEVYTGPSKPDAGAVISERRIESSLDLSNGDIVIERSCIRPTSVGGGMAVVTTTDVNQCDDEGCAVTSSMVTIRDSDIDGSLISPENIAYSCAFQGVGTLERNHVHDTGSGICFFGTGNTLDAIADGNYVHDLRAFGDPATTGSHNESFTIRDFDPSDNPDRRLVVRNNRLDCDTGNDSGAMFIQAYAGYIDQVRLEGNLLEGNGYQLVLEANGSGYGMSMAAVDNRFSGTGYGPGYVDDGGQGYGWTTWEDNYIDDPSRPDHRGDPIPSL
jgi:hypothetical protein